jgi:DNA polymerase-3 subunit epsilon
VSRSTKPLVVAKRHATRDGYQRLIFGGGEKIAPEDAPSIMAVFKNRSQATRWLTEASRKHRLCHKLLGLENPRGACFQYQLHRCDGACVGEVSPEEHNARFERAFEQRKVYAWPFKGGIIIQEQGPEGEDGEVFLVDQWCLLAGFKRSPFGQGPFIRGEYTFDYDSYKVLLKYLSNPVNRSNIRRLQQGDLERYLASQEETE